MQRGRALKFWRSEKKGPDKIMLMLPLNLESIILFSVGLTPIFLGEKREGPDFFCAENFFLQQAAPSLTSVLNGLSCKS